MSRALLKSRWEQVKLNVSEQFGGGEIVDVDTIIYLIGIQELGQGYRDFQKDEKMNLMHIAICKLLEPLGYYTFDAIDTDGWPHYTVKKELPFLKPGEQSILMKKAIVEYFLENKMIE